MNGLPERENLRTDEVAEYFNVTARHVRNLIEEGLLDGFKVGFVWRIKRESVLVFEAENGS